MCVLLSEDQFTSTLRTTSKVWLRVQTWFKVGFRQDLRSWGWLSINVKQN